MIFRLTDPITNQPLAKPVFVGMVFSGKFHQFRRDPVWYATVRAPDRYELYPIDDKNITVVCPD
jgi:hypothetical protein